MNKHKLFIIAVALIISVTVIHSCKKEKEVTLESITVTTQPAKKTYIVGDTFDPAGMEVTATYSDNTTQPVTVTTDMLEYDFSKAGTGKTVTITFTEKDNTVQTSVDGITVNELASVEVTLVSIEVGGTPEKTEYFVGDSFNPTGITVTAKFSDNSTLTVPLDELVFDADFSKVAGTNISVKVSFTYKDITKDDEIKGITVKEKDPWIPPTSGNVGPRPNTADDPANGIYVSPDGNDATANGSIDRPYKSINTALSKAQSGATIILRSGTYREMQNVRVNLPNITIKSRKDEWAIIDLTTYNPGNQEHSGVHFRPDASGCKLQSVEVIGGFYAVCMETTWDWGPSYPTRYGASNIIIEDCKLHDSRNDVVKVKPNCKNITIRYNEIYNSGREHVSHADFETGQRNAEGIDNVNGDGMHVHNNYIHDICSNGIYAKGGATDALIENNLIKNTYGGGIMVGFDTSPEFFSTAVNPKYYENIRGVVRNNLIIDTGWEGIGLYASKDAQVYNNTIVNAVGYGRGLFHSPIYFGIATQDWKNPTGCPPSINPHIHHNIVCQPNTYNNRIIDIRYATDVYSFGLSGLDGKPTMNDNCYYVAGKNARFTDNRPDSKLTNAGLAAWQSHIGGDNGSLEVDPALDADYMPANAQCVEMGIQISLK